MEQISPKKNLTIWLILVVLLVFIGVTLIIVLINHSNKTDNSKSQIADPSAVYCKEQGYQYKIKTSVNGGQYGVCVFNNGRECDSWKYYDHTCSPDNA